MSSEPGPQKQPASVARIQAQTKQTQIALSEISNDKPDSFEEYQEQFALLKKFSAALTDTSDTQTEELEAP